MTLAQKIEQVLKDELKPESIKTVIEMAEFLKFKKDKRSGMRSMSLNLNI